MIFFLHIRKCAGTSIVDMFNKFDFKLHFPHIEGIPCDFESGKVITFWNFDINDIHLWINEKKKMGVNFISLEWNFFDYQVFSSLQKSHEFIISIRDPYERFISDYYYSNIYDKKYSSIYDFYKGKKYVFGSFDKKKYNKDQKKYTEGITVRKKNIVIRFINYYIKRPLKYDKMKKKYINNRDKVVCSSNKFNYYVRMLNGLGDMPNVELNQNHLEIAKKILIKFKSIIIVEDKKSWEILYNFGMYGEISKINVGSRLKEVPKEFKEFFIQNNYLDYEIYNYAKSLTK